MKVPSELSVSSAPEASVISEPTSPLSPFTSVTVSVSLLASASAPLPLSAKTSPASAGPSSLTDTASSSATGSVLVRAMETVSATGVVPSVTDMDSVSPSRSSAAGS